MAIELAFGLSVDEFLDHGFDKRSELLGGETRPNPMPGFLIPECRCL